VEWDIRPAVIVRKVSGGTRSKQVSDIRALLMSLFGTSQEHGLDPLEASGGMLRPLHSDPIPSHDNRTVTIPRSVQENSEVNGK